MAHDYTDAAIDVEALLGFHSAVHFWGSSDRRLPPYRCTPARSDQAVASEGGVGRRSLPALTRSAKNA
jgi:hypothetical protein